MRRAARVSQLAAGWAAPVLLVHVAAAQEFFPGCRTDQPGYSVERFEGQVSAGERFTRAFGSGFTFSLEPIDTGWYIVVSEKGSQEDLTRLTPPRHFVPNPRFIEGWHFRNAANTGPNDGSVNAPQERRGFVFSPEVGRTIDGPTAAAQLTADEMERVAKFGSGELRIAEYRLDGPGSVRRARMLWLKFEVCVSVAAGRPGGQPSVR